MIKRLIAWALKLWATRPRQDSSHRPMWLAGDNLNPEWIDRSGPGKELD